MAVSSRARRPLDDRRKEVFLEALRQTGSVRHASRVASPHSRAPHFGYATFQDEMRRNPIFAAQVEEARNYAIGRAEALLLERAMTPDERPVVDKNGVVVGVQKQHGAANQALLRFLERHDPEWAPRKNIGGAIAHTHDHRHLHASLGGSSAAFAVTADDLIRLPEAKRDTLLALLEEIEDARDANESPAEPAFLPAAPAGGGGSGD